MLRFDDLQKKLDEMDHIELYHFFKRFNEYMTTRLILKKIPKWNSDIRIQLDMLDYKHLSEINKSFNFYIKERLVKVEY